MHAGGDETGNVGDIRKMVGVHVVGDGLNSLPLDLTRIGRVARDDHIGVELGGVVGQALVVEIPRFGIDLVLFDGVGLADEVCRMAVAQMPAVIEVQRENFIAGVQRRKVDGLIGLRAGVGLDVDVFGAPELLRAVDGELLDLVGVLTAGVIPLAGIPLGVLVRQRATLRLEDGLADVVLAGDHRQRLFLSGVLAGKGVCGRGIDRPNLLVVHTQTRPLTPISGSLRSLLAGGSPDRRPLSLAGQRESTRSATALI